MPCVPELRCQLAEWASTEKVDSRGVGNPIIMEIGEAPGKEEDRHGVAFIGPSGERLDYYNDAVGITNVTRITNVVRCCPYKDNSRKKVVKPSKKVVEHCASSFLIPEIIQADPKVIVALGNSAWSFFGKGPISKVSGSVFAFTAKAEDYPMLLSEDLTIPVIPTFHPSHALRGNVSSDRAIMEALATAKRVAEGAEASKGDYYCYTSIDAFEDTMRAVVDSYKSGTLGLPAIACDLETEERDPHDPSKRIVGVGFSWQEGTGIFLPYNGYQSPWVDQLGPLARIRKILKYVFDSVPVIGQNFEFDRRWLWYHMGIEVTLHFDTLAAHKWLYSDTRPHNLEYMTGAYTDLFMHKAQAKSAGAYDGENMVNTDLDIVSDLCAGDCDATLRLFGVFTRMLRDWGTESDFYEWSMKPIQEMFGLEQAGAYLDQDVVGKLRKYFKRKMVEATDQAKGITINGINLEDAFRKSYCDDDGNPRGLGLLLSSPTRNAHLLFKMLKVPPPGKKHGESTAELPLTLVKRDLLTKHGTWDTWDQSAVSREVMEWSMGVREFIDCVFKYRRAEKLHGTYVNGFSKLTRADGCVHPHYHICHAVTGRSSVSDPALQTLPSRSEDGRRFKEAFTSRFLRGLLYNGDESQVEVRALAYYSQDPAMLNLFRVGEDMHRLVASKFYGCTPSEVTKDQRSGIKTVVFGMFYDRTAEAISEAQNMPLDQVQGIMDAFWAMFSVAAAWKEQTVWYAHQHGGVFGAQNRWRWLPHINSDDRKLANEAKRQAGNTPIQGLASDFAQHGIVRSMRRMRHENFGSIPFSFVHDSYSVDVYPGELFDVVGLCEYEFVVRAHELFPWWNLPFKFEHEIGLNLKDMVEVTVEGDVIRSAPEKTPDTINGIASVIESWYNCRNVVVADTDDGYVLEALLGPRNLIDRGERPLLYCDDEWRKPALRPFAEQALELTI